METDYTNERVWKFRVKDIKTKENVELDVWNSEAVPIALEDESILGLPLEIKKENEDSYEIKQDDDSLFSDIKREFKDPFITKELQIKLFRIDDTLRDVKGESISSELKNIKTDQDYLNEESDLLVKKYDVKKEEKMEEDLFEEVKNFELKTKATSDFESNFEGESISSELTNVGTDRDSLNGEFQLDCNTIDATDDEKMENFQKLLKEHQDNDICKLCGKNNIANQSRKTLHLMMHLGIKPFKCDVCFKSFSQKGHLKTHKIMHSDKTPLQCKFCEKSFKWPCSFKTHVETCRPKKGDRPKSKFLCKMCKPGKFFSSKRSLQTHEMIHKNIKPYSCKLCGKSFTQNGNLKVHLELHSDTKPYPCNQCAMRFKTKKDQSRHMITHSNERKHVCSECGEKFKWRITLKHHLLKHSPSNNYVCHTCGAKFIVETIYKNHLRTHTSSNKVTCNFCDKQFKLLSYLKNHIKNVHSDNVFKCLKCGVAFPCRQYLFIHLRKHSDSHPYSCNSCGLSYKSKIALRKHITVKKHYL